MRSLWFVVSFLRYFPGPPLIDLPPSALLLPDGLRRGGADHRRAGADHPITHDPSGWEATPGGLL